MRTSAILSAFLVAAILLVACSEPNGPTVVSQAGPRPSFDFINGPSEPGLFLVRYQRRFGFVARDFEKELFAFHSSDNANGSCDEPVTAINLADRQVLLSPADEILIMDLFLAAEHSVRVYDWTGLPDPYGSNGCAYLDFDLLAEGKARFQLTDNDVLTLLRTEPIRANAFGFMAEGTLNLVAGGQAHYNTAQRFVYFGFSEFTARINLTPDPR